MRTDFYYIPDEDHLRFACRIAQKAFENKHQAYIHTDSDADAEHINKLLWTFQQNSFIPHALIGEHQDNPPPIEIGTGEKPKHHNDILINLSNNIPDFAKQFERIIEVVANNNKQQENAEQRKQHYKKLNTEIKEHQLSAA